MRNVHVGQTQWVFAMLLALTSVSCAAPRAVRLKGDPILTPASSPTIGDNLNGPSLIRVPAWVKNPLGRYYLYFAHHQGTFIRMAYANRLPGPWTVYAPGVLQMSAVTACHDHIASPDVHVDDAKRRIRMYFHCPAGKSKRDIEEQKTFVAFSGDGLHFTAKEQPLGPAYMSVFHWDGYYYAVARKGVFLRSRDGITPFEQGPTLFSEDKNLILRHAAVDVKGNQLSVYYSRIGDNPESIVVSRIALTPDWSSWKASPPTVVLAPGTVAEGVNLPSEPSRRDDAPGRVRQLRDPGIFHENGKTYLLYSIAGESGISIAELTNP